MEIKKIENCDYVMFPRQQRPGLKPKHVEREAFKAKLKHIEGHGDYWLLYQQSTFNRFENKNIHENQLFLGRNKTKKLDFVPFLEKVVSLHSVIKDGYLWKVKIL